MTKPATGAVELERENAELRRQLAESLAQQTATAEVLQVINSSPGDLAPVFQAILEKAHALCGAGHGALFVRDGEVFKPAALHAAPGPLAELLRQRGLGPDAPAIRALLDGAPFVHIPDMTRLDHPVVRTAVANGVRTLLSVPLRRDGLLGVIVAVRFEVRPFIESEIALLQNFAAQAVIAMENARLLTETREALDQQTATAEVLQVINSSPGDLAPVFDAMLEKAHKLCGVGHGSLQLYEDGRFRAVATRGVVAEAASLLRQPREPGPGGERILAGARFHEIEDRVEAAPQSPALSSLRRAMAEQGVVRRLFVPLRHGTSLLGMIVAGRTEARPFSDKEIALLQNFAAQAVIAIENARLLTETREALDQQTATAEVLQVINSSPGDLAPVFDAMLEKAMRLCGVAFGSLQTYDGEVFRSVAERGLPKAFAERLRQGYRPSPGHPASRLIEGERFAQVPNLAETDTAQGAFEIGGMRTLLSVPMRREGKLVGIINLARDRVELFTDKQIALVENFAAQAVIAIENARLFDELRARTDEIAGFNRELEARVAAQVGELGRVEHLKRFLPPQLAELIVSQGDESILKSHRREIVVVFADVRGYTVFTETAEPEDVIEFLGEYHATLGPLTTRFEGTLSHFLGDGLMVFFNDPVPCPDPAERAVKMAVAMREAAGGLIAAWRRRGHQLGFGIGIAQGYATLGQIGFADRSDYTAIGTVTNLASRLCGEAKDGQILISRRVAMAVESTAAIEEIGDLSLKGLSQAVAVYNVV